MTKVVGVRLTDYQIEKLKEISGGEVVNHIRNLINNDIDAYNRAKYDGSGEDKTS